MACGSWSQCPALDLATDVHRLRLLGFIAMTLPFSFRGRFVLMPLHYELTLLRAQAAEPSCRCGLQTGVQFRPAVAGNPEG